MGIISGEKLNDFFKIDCFATPFAVLIPLVNGSTVPYFSQFVTAEVGDRFIFAILAASASYIAVLAVMKIVAPKTNLGLF